MKKVLSLLVLVAFIITIWGCTPKSEYDKLLDQKDAIQKKCTALSAEIAGYKKTIAAREMEIKDLKSELKLAKAKIKSLERKLERLKSAVKE